MSNRNRNTLNFVLGIALAVFLGLMVIAINGCGAEPMVRVDSWQGTVESYDDDGAPDLVTGDMDLSINGFLASFAYQTVFKQNGNIESTLCVKAQGLQLCVGLVCTPDSGCEPVLGAP